MRHRLPLALSSAALVLVVLGSTGLGRASVRASETLITGKQIATHTVGNRNLATGSIDGRALAPGAVSAGNLTTALRQEVATRGLQGPKGDTGAQGTTGAQGPAGSQGPQGPAGSGGGQIVGGGAQYTTDSNGVDTGSIEDMYMGMGLSLSSDAEVRVQQVLPVAGTVGKLHVSLGDGTAHGTLTFTVRKNGSDTTIACSIDTAPGSCSDTTDTASYASGDTIDVKITSDNATTSGEDGAWTAFFTGS